MNLKSTLVIWLTVMLFIYAGVPAIAQEKPIQVSLVNPIQIFPENTSIKGLRLNLIYGKNTKITGLDLGVANHLTSGLSKGVQFGIVGIVDADFIGWQDNSINIANGNFEGFQFGFVNYTHSMNGLQLGFINYAENMKGVQIGLLNIIRQGGAFPFFPIVNWSF